MIYGILSTIVFIVILPFWLLAGIFKPKLIYGLKEKMALYNSPHLNSPIIFYGVSVGEVLAMENTIRKAHERFPQTPLIVMTGTKTGQETAKKKLSDCASFITYFPLDFPLFINLMLKKLSPKAIFIMETELWPNFANITHKRKIPVYIINARISDRTFNSYKKLQFIFKPILNKYAAIFPQSNHDSEKFKSLGAQKVKVMGNLKFDIKTPAPIEFTHTAPTIIAGSTHSGEDEIILSAYKSLKTEIPNLKLIIAPRHPERNNTVYKLIESTGFSASRRSENGSPETSDILLLDTLGELARLYAHCDVAFIGGSFNKTGGHNPLEATIFSKPVISGNSTHNFKDIYEILTRNHAAKIVKTEQELTSALKNLLTDKSLYEKATSACQKVFTENSGALDFVIEVLQTVV
ncbi:3-deoxy-D-manno-octulosonic acid transferase [bacterium]|nr:3-deoxy-D-manno-octulosonic acid transferase [bacterium]